MESTGENSQMPEKPFQRRPYQMAGLIVGLLVFAAAILTGPPASMPMAAWYVAAVAALMAIWWITEAIPISATSFLPLALFPLLGVASIKETATPYANPIIFLFLGGFMIAAAMEKWQLHRRIALTILTLVGTRPDALIGGFMIASAGLSMWVSNTATTIMMLPIGLSVIGLVNERGNGNKSGNTDAADPFPIALLLSIAYAATIGGLGTLIGTVPNALFAGYMNEEYGMQIGFAQWMLVGVPVAVVLLGFTWWVLTRWAFAIGQTKMDGVEKIIQAELDAMGPISRGEKLTALVFACVAIAWITRPLIQEIFPGLGISDPGIAIIGALALFLVPVDWRRGIFILDREWAHKLPWSVMILFGGGLSLAAAVTASGLALSIGDMLSAFESWPQFAIIVAVIALVIYLTELTSNTATTVVFLPITAALALLVGLTPVDLMVPAVLAASCAFMLPVATPPNAIIFGSGKLNVPQMARAGFMINFGAIVLITIAAYSLIPAVFG
jgi:solute carrier family 13 (sodium-dependent dicarboxylate transporter), member 2/3/5